MPTDGQPESLREQPAPYAPPSETQRLIDELYKEELREARAMTPEQKILVGRNCLQARNPSHHHAGGHP